MAATGASDNNYRASSMGPHEFCQASTETGHANSKALRIADRSTIAIEKTQKARFVALISPLLTAPNPSSAVGRDAMACMANSTIDALANPKTKGAAICCTYIYMDQYGTAFLENPRKFEANTPCLQGVTCWDYE